MALYRKYRPQSFTEVIGQELVVQTLQNALKHDIPAHSYLFTGPRGTGKTSLARIFAKALNCQDRKEAAACGKCPHCQAVENNQSLDILEIDAASYTGVDNIRALRETMDNAPLLGRYKIYIIDEVHMLSIGAFNALLKVMEEPPSHVIFLLATTELHKVPKTVLSRCQRFDLRKLTLTEIIQKLEVICKKEKITIEKEALVHIAKNSGGALRDAESLLTQLHTLADKKITAAFVQESLGISDSETLFRLLRCFANNDAQGILSIIKEFENAGKNANSLTQDITTLLRNILLYKASRNFNVEPLSLLTSHEQSETSDIATSLSYQQITRLLEDLEEASVKMRNSAFGFLALEIAMIKNLSEEENDTPKPPTPTPSPEKKESPKEERKESITAKTQAAPIVEVAPEPKVFQENSVTLDQVRQKWTQVVEKAKLLNASLSVALQGARPVHIEANVLHISVKYKFHLERLNDPVHRLTLQEAFDTILETNLRFLIVPEEKQKSAPKEQEGDSLVQHALELLGGSVI